jgi:hypothetical protein
VASLYIGPAPWCGRTPETQWPQGALATYIKKKRSALSAVLAAPLARGSGTQGGGAGASNVKAVGQLAFLGKNYGRA